MTAVVKVILPKITHLAGEAGLALATNDFEPALSQLSYYIIPEVAPTYKDDFSTPSALGRRAK
jgi:hypothetical protein